MRVVILVPRRDDNGHRDRLWGWCKARWRQYHPTLPIYEGHHEQGPFNRSAAINIAARLAGDWDLAVIIDSDIFLRVSQVEEAIETAARTRLVTWAHRRWRGFHEDHTARVIGKRPLDFGPQVDHDDMDIYVERTNPLSWSCCVVVPRAAWDDMGGFDERFVGWGFEDMAFKSVVQGLYGWDRIGGDVFHLYHPRSEERIVKGLPAETATPEYLTNARLGRRYMVAQYRDHGFGDEGETLSAELRVRHIANLTLDDAKLEQYAKRYGLPDWSAWWPTLEELRDGWKAGPNQTVTVIVHTGGTDETWPERSAYLRASLQSLEQNVTGPIVQRVIYSDWGADRLPELGIIAAKHGYYVVGEGHHGYTGSMSRMWRYIAKRAKGEYVFATEDDFLYERPVDLVPLIETLHDNQHLAQVALLRDPYPSEQAKGGILGWPDEAFQRVGVNGTSRLEHRLFYTANPSLIRRSLTANPWPTGRHSETLFGKALLADERLRFAFWGDGWSAIRHIGAVRAGEGY